MILTPPDRGVYDPSITMILTPPDRGVYDPSITMILTTPDRGVYQAVGVLLVVGYLLQLEVLV